jgi:transcriptional regulator with XRE-family HTH domain
VTKSIFTADYEHFRFLLVETRKKAGLTQVEVAERLSRPQSFVCKYEQGERRLDVVEFIQVANALGIDPAKFIRTLTSGR